MLRQIQDICNLSFVFFDSFLTRGKYPKRFAGVVFDNKFT